MLTSPSPTPPAAPPFIVVLTGGVASGKSTVAQCFADWGAKVLDTDQFSRTLTAAGGAALPMIRQTFGDDYAPINATEGLNRPLMRQRVFADSAARRALENILHPMIRAIQWQSIMTPPFAVITVVQIPLFVETGAKRWLVHPDRPDDSLIPFQRVLAVDCEENTQLERMIQNRAMNEVNARAIIQAQTPRHERMMAADDVLHNHENLAKLTLRAWWRFCEYSARSRAGSSG